MKKAEMKEQVAKLHEIADSVRTQLGEESVITFDNNIWEPIEAISSGSVVLDRALGVGGFPRGRIVELFGSEGSGKTSISLATIVQAQRAGEICAFIDAENSFNPEWAALLGVDMKFLLLSQESCCETVFALIDQFIEKGVTVIVVDSIASLSPRAELEGETGDLHVGLMARLMAQALRRLSGKLNRSRVLAIFINQLRLQIGIMFGNPETTPGGKALKFHSSIRLDVRSATKIKKADEVVGMEIKASVVKNKVAPPFKSAVVDFLFDRGFDNEAAYVDDAVEKGVFKKKGSYLEYQGMNKYRADWCELLRTDTALFKQIVKEVDSAPQV